MKLSIVATLYKSEDYVEEFCRRASECAEQLVSDDFEIVLVNDGSPDNSLEIAVEIAAVNTNVVVVDLSRNFGHHKAMMTGLDYAQGERVFLIDVDLEENPEWLLRFTEELNEQGCDVVYGVQKKRKGGIFERVSGKVFYYLFRKITGLSIPEDVTTARLMTRRYVDALLMHDEREVFLAGLWLITGFLQCPLVVSKQHSSETTYSLFHKLSIFVNSITSFSNIPLISIFYVGVAILLVSGGFATYLMISWLLFSNSVSGWTSVMVSIWFLGGLMISLIGVVGIYLAKVFSETKRRPYTIVRQVYNGVLKKRGR